MWWGYHERSYLKITFFYLVPNYLECILKYMYKNNQLVVIDILWPTKSNFLFYWQKKKIKLQLNDWLKVLPFLLHVYWVGLRENLISRSANIGLARWRSLRLAHIDLRTGSHFIFILSCDWTKGKLHHFYAFPLFPIRKERTLMESYHYCAYRR